MLQEFLPIAVLIVLAAILAVLVLILGAIFGPRRPTRRKSETYESGMTPYGPGSRRVSIRYYLVGVLFILFDVEVVFFLPWAVVFKQLKVFGLIEMFAFILILLVGYVYAWKEGAFEWE